jgi:anthranilate synthase component I
MPSHQSFEDFARFYQSGNAQFVSQQLVADLETPVSAYLKLKAVFGGTTFLLESVEGGAVRGRYSMIGLSPDLRLTVTGTTASLNDQHHGTVEQSDDPLALIRDALKRSDVDPVEGLPPMAAGVFGFMGYDMVRLMERLSASKPDPIGIPDAVLVRPTVMVIFDAVKDLIFVLTVARPKPGRTAKSAWETAQEAIERTVETIEGPLSAEMKSGSVGEGSITVASARSNTSETEFVAMVDKAKDYILAGDVFQVVLSQRFETDFSLPPFSLYRALRRVNPAPFLCYLDFEDFQIVCSSPEILVRLRGDEVTIRPIAGTRPRGATQTEDKMLANELLADPKERAEHLMLLDLGRNDVGRVSAIGSVRVEGSFFLEYYSHVMHIVSDVRGTIDLGKDRIDALAAGFPAGTVSGAPKIRAMEIIDELEKDKRGPYAGCIGYFGADGSMDTCIVLRTAVVKNGRMYVQAGAGIVADSVAASEQAECTNKAKALFKAAEAAAEFAAASRRSQ